MTADLRPAWPERKGLTVDEVAVQMAPAACPRARPGRSDDMATPPQETGGPSRPKAEQITFEDFVEVATRAVLRALETSSLNPQPLPPGPDGTSVEVSPQPQPPGRAAAPLNPQPLPPVITVGLVFTPKDASGAAATVER
jgi:hypothetical protein